MIVIGQLGQEYNNILLLHSCVQLPVWSVFVQHMWYTTFCRSVPQH